MSREVESWAREQKTGDPVRKAVLMALGNYADPFGRNCYPSIPRVAEEVEVSVRTVQRHLNALEDMGLVKRVERLREDGSLSSNLFTFPPYTPPKVSHRPPPKATGGGDNLTPGGDNLSPAGDASVTRVVTMVSPPETPTESFPPTAGERSPAAPPQGGLPLGFNAEEREEEPEPSATKSKRGNRLPEDWTPPPVETLPPSVQTVINQWPAGAYEFVAAGFAAHWTGESGARASKRDWNAAWTKWLTSESSRIMAMGRNGIAFATVQRETTHTAEFAEVDRLQQSEDRRVGAIRKMLRQDVGERTYSGWLKTTAIGIDKDGSGWAMNVISPSRFMADWLQQHLGATILAAARKAVETNSVTVHYEVVSDR